jgi:gamma-glutamyl:cysteine ligase YbdK (ATP-grasp superfamily)
MAVRKSYFLIAVFILLLAGCGQPISVEEADAQLCADLEAFRAAVDGLNALTTESTVDEAEAALDLVADTWDELASSIYLVQDAQYEALDEAYEDLDDALRDIGEASTIGEASASIQDEVANVNAAYDEFYALQCP